MELVKIIFENFGGREMERIFRTCFFLSLVLKEFVLSIFSVPADPKSIDSVPVKNEQISEYFFAPDSSEGSLDDFQLFQFIWTLSQLETQGTNAPKQS